MPGNDRPTTISRRRFLKRTGWLAAGITVIASCSAIRIVWPALPTFDYPEMEDGFAWIQILPGGRVRFFCPRMEMGQGASLGLAQVVAEELNIGPQEIECVLPDTDQTPPFKMTVGSESIANFFTPVSYAAAGLREKLRGMAAETTGFGHGQVADGRSGFILPDGSEILYASLTPATPVLMTAADAPSNINAMLRHAVQRQGRYKAIGHSWKHHELQAIVTGQTVYSRDVSVPGMLYGQVLRQPAFGARLLSANGGAAKAVPGVRAVVIDKGINFAGVVTDSPFALSAATKALEARWELPTTPNQDTIDTSLDVERHRANDDLEHTLAETGDLTVGRARAQTEVTARYDTSFAAHAAIEPRASIAWVREDKVEVWCGSQDPFFIQRLVAHTIDRDVGDIVVHSHRLGGGFGGRIWCQASQEAVRLSAAVGRPVRVQWDREAEFQNNYFQPGYSHFIDAGVTPEGRLSHWDHDFVSSPIMTGPITGGMAWMLDRVMADEGTARGGLSQYHVADRRVRYSDVRTSVPTGAWRGLGAAPNTFAIESMIDELATRVGIDPLEFRLQNLPPEGERLAAVLRRAAEISHWGKRLPKDTGRGIACAVYKDLTAVAVVAEVEIDHGAGRLRVTKTWCAQDCGLVVNPDQVENLVMGNIVWGCGMALKERITVDAGAVGENNFDGYELLRHHESPEMTVDLVTPPNTPPVGVGESAFAPVAPAIANAVFAATGRRVRRLPLSYDSVFSTLES